VENIYWPGLENHKGHDIAKKQMSDFGGMISFNIKGDSLESALHFVKSVKLITLAESLGGVESLISHPASMTHAAIPREVREKVGVTDGLIRISLGVEDSADLIADLEQAFNAIS
jgi:cystathionine beta-lyase/cystathionine gamma-synthase